MNNFKILAIEGMPGIGKTTQVFLLKNYLEQTYDNKFQVFETEMEKPDDVIRVNHEIGEFLETEGNVAIIDGTIASVVVYSDIIKNHFGVSINEMDDQVKSYLNLIHKYRTINCLVVSDDMKKLESRTSFSTMYLDTFKNGFHYFEQSQIASNLNYLRVFINGSDKIMVVFDKIKKTLNI